MIRSRADATEEDVLAFRNAIYGRELDKVLATLAADPSWATTPAPRLGGPYSASHETPLLWAMQCYPPCMELLRVLVPLSDITARTSAGTATP